MQYVDVVALFNIAGVVLHGCHVIFTMQVSAKNIGIDMYLTSSDW